MATCRAEDPAAPELAAVSEARPQHKRLLLFVTMALLLVDTQDGRR